VLAHFGIPKIKATDWRLHIGGLVSAPTTLSLASLRKFRKREVQSFLKCAGFPHKPYINTHNVSNAVWAGADLGEVLDSVGVDPKASFIWSYGSDHGSYADWRANEYVKDLPM
jgi:sulfane dehydrogenase subunit SoxC